jgi:hypothetical protein
VEAKMSPPNPIDVAREQLDVAIELFLSQRSYVSAIVLAGSAEEIFARLLPRGENAIDAEFRTIDELERIYPVFGIYDCKAAEKERREGFAEFKRRMLNFAKHGPEKRKSKIWPGQKVQPPSIETIAQETIIRASENGGKLGIPESESLKRFDEWFYREVVGYENSN